MCNWKTLPLWAPGPITLTITLRPSDSQELIVM